MITVRYDNYEKSVLLLAPTGLPGQVKAADVGSYFHIWKTR